MSNELYAAGLGLMMSSPGGLTELQPGTDYLRSSGADRLAAFVADQRLVLVGTGSPQLDYTIHIHDGEIPQEIALRMVATTKFGLYVTGGAVVFRDGYDLFDWEPCSDNEVIAPISDGYYVVTVGWLRSERHSHMILHVSLTPSASRISGNHSLIYVAG